MLYADGAGVYPDRGGTVSHYRDPPLAVISDGAVIIAAAESCGCKGGEYENCSGAPAAADELRRMTVLPA